MRTDEAMHVEDLHATLTAKIKSDAEVIAALRGAIYKAGVMLSQGYSKMAVENHLRDTYEQNAGESK